MATELTVNSIEFVSHQISVNKINSYLKIVYKKGLSEEFVQPNHRQKLKR